MDEGRDRLLAVLEQTTKMLSKATSDEERMRLLAVVDHTTKLLSNLNVNQPASPSGKKKTKVHQRGSQSLVDLSGNARSAQPRMEGRGQGYGNQREYSKQGQRPQEAPPPYHVAVGNTNPFQPSAPMLSNPPPLLSAPYPVGHQPYKQNQGTFYVGQPFYSAIRTPNQPVQRYSNPRFNKPFQHRYPPPAASKLASKQDASSNPSFVYLQDLVNEMIKQEGFFSTVDKLAKDMDKNYDCVLKMVKTNCGIFSTMKDDSNDNVMVELCPNVQLCEYHIGKNSCIKKKCFNLHICHDFLAMSCSEAGCQYGHSFKTDHNNNILKTLFLQDIPAPVLLKLMQKALSGKLFPKICHYYNHGNCQKSTGCSNLHICEKYVRTLGTCSQDQCSLIHNVRDNKLKSLLTKFGVSTNESPRDILKIINDKCKRCDGDSSDDDQNEDSDTEKSFEFIKKTKQLKKTNKRAVARKKTAPESKTVFAWQLIGTVDSPLVCYMGIEGKCQYLTEGCKFLHSKHTSQWQFVDDKKWYNFHPYHSEILNTKFGDVNCDKTSLPKLDPSKVNDNMKGIFSLLGMKGLEVDFVGMTIDCEAPKKLYEIRQLTTASSVVCNNRNSTIFNWYFRDDQDQWILYGNADTSSQSIEKAFQENPVGKAKFKSSINQFEYEVDFVKMTQRNTSTNKIRAIRRRPQLFSSQTKSNVIAPTTNLPSHWDSLDSNDEHKLIKLSSSVDEYKDIKEDVVRFLPMSNVTNVYRVQNLHIWKQYKNKEKEMKKMIDGNLNIQRLFNGIDSNFLNDICMNNLEWRVHEAQKPKPYGSGAYFYNSAADACKNSTVDFMGNKVLLVFEVILGSITTGTQGLTRPPENTATKALYDTTCDDISCPRVFVKYNKQEYYPAYAVEIK